MDPFTLNRFSKEIEKLIVEKANNEGHEILVRKFLRKFLNEPIDKDASETLMISFAIFVRNGFMVENDCLVIMRHLGILIE